MFYNLPVVLISNPETATPTPVDNGDISALFHLRLDAQKGFEKIETFQKARAQSALILIKLALARGLLTPAHFRRVIDFGAGRGGTTFALVNIAKIVEGEVEAVEEDPERGLKIVNAGILPIEFVHIGEGIASLESLATNESNEVDLVTSFMLQPSQNGQLFRALATVSSCLLTDMGLLLVNSDLKTLNGVETICRESGAQLYNLGQKMERDNNDNDIFTGTFILPKAACQAIVS